MAGGIAEYFHLSPLVVRALLVIAALVMAPMTLPTVALLYLALALLIPLEPREDG